SDRPRRAGLPLHSVRHERRAHPDRGRMHRRCQMVHRAGERLRQGAQCVRTADRAESGRAIPDRARLCADARRRADGARSRGALRGRPRLRRGSQYGEAARRRRVLGRGRHVRADPRRLRLCRGIRHRAQVPRDPALPGGADLDQSHLVVSGRARAPPAAVVLNCCDKLARSNDERAGSVLPLSPCGRGCRAAEGGEAGEELSPGPLTRRLTAFGATLSRKGRGFPCARHRMSNLMDTVSLPLQGLLAVSIEQAVAAPMCTCRLADAGARVIKVERPEGDFARTYDTVAGGECSYFVWLNRGKESVVLDLTKQEDKALLETMLERADVFVQNLKPGALAKLGFAVPRLRKDHPKLIVCSISGYGETGPYAARKAYDLLIQAEAGLASVTGGPEAPARVAAALARMDVAHLSEKLLAADIAFARVSDMALLASHPHLRRIAVGLPQGSVSYPAPPRVRAGETTRRYGPVPALGEHTEKVRAEFLPAAPEH